ncbi:hypothetical protein Ancab_004485 [Ancistrocladus abbreviatus]
MELRSFPFSETLHFGKASPSRFSLITSPSLSLSTPIRFNKRHLPLLTSLRFSISSHRFSLLPQHPFAKFPTPLLASASSSSSFAEDIEKDKLPADIDVTETREPNSGVRLSVSVPSAVCEDCYKRVIREFMKQAKVPGFRPGKNVPESVLLSYVGKQNVRKATVEPILKRTLPHALSSVTGSALKDSIRIATKFSEMEETYASSNPVSLKKTRQRRWC